MKILKKMLVLILCIVIVIQIWPVGALSESEIEADENALLEILAKKKRKKLE